MEYSVIIRTIGKAGKKYQRLLDSINSSSILPKEIIVVIPEGFDLPKEQLGFENFVFCKRGMVNQRIEGIAHCKTDYALILDDDIAFDSDFVEIVSKPVISGEYAISSGPLLEFFPPKGKHSFFAAVTGNAIPTLFHKNRYNTILHTTGYSYNRNIVFNQNKLYETQSAAWTCFFADVNKLRSIHFEDELWLDAHKYSAHDDTAMFYKAWLMGHKSVIVADALYKHLDAKTSKIDNVEAREFALGFNTFVFWKRFILEPSGGVGKLWSRFCLGYFLLVAKLISLIKNTSGNTKKHYFVGLKQGMKWCKTIDYKSLKRIRNEK